MDKQPIRQQVVKALIIDNGKLLLLWDPNIRTKDKWETPGGRKRENESDKDALTREAMEEAGIEIRVERLIDDWEFPLPWKNWILVGKSYLCAPVTKDVRLEDPEKQHTRYEWVDLKKAKDLDLVSWLKNSIDRLG